jgi:hypothetical protein
MLSSEGIDKSKKYGRFCNKIFKYENIFSPMSPHVPYGLRGPSFPGCGRSVTDF